jgi:inner membrane protein involved in colicin E2 resistance
MRLTSRSSRAVSARMFARLRWPTRCAVRALYSLLQLKDVALLSGSILLFALLSLAMWFTRNLHRSQPA